MWNQSHLLERLADVISELSPSAAAGTVFWPTGCCRTITVCYSHFQSQLHSTIITLHKVSKNDEVNRNTYFQEKAKGTNTCFWMTICRNR